MLSLSDGSKRLNVLRETPCAMTELLCYDLTNLLVPHVHQRFTICDLLLNAAAACPPLRVHSEAAPTSGLTGTPSAGALSNK